MYRGRTRSAYFDIPEDEKCRSCYSQQLEKAVHYERHMIEQFEEYAREKIKSDLEKDELLQKLKILEEDLKKSESGWQEEKDARRKCETEMQASEANAREKDALIQSLQSDLQKTNDIIAKLQSEFRSSHAGSEEGSRGPNELVEQVRTLVEDARQAQAGWQREKETRVKLEAKLKETEAQLGDRDVGMENIRSDLLKANEIIRKLQSEIQKMHSKLDLLNQVTTKQDEVVYRKESRVKELEKDLKLCIERMKKKESEQQSLREQLAGLRLKCEESQKLIKTNEKVITWLNKQLADLQVGTSDSPNNATSSTNFRQGLHSRQPSHRYKSSAQDAATGAFPDLPKVNLVDKDGRGGAGAVSRRRESHTLGQQQHHGQPPLPQPQPSLAPVAQQVYQRNPLFTARSSDPFKCAKVAK